MSGRLIGIDLGTTTTVAAVAQASPQVIINELGSRQTPSIVGFTRKGERVIGEFAKRQLMAEPQRTIHSVRRFLGRRYEEVWEDIRRVPYAVRRRDDGGVAIEVDGRLYAPEELTAFVLAAIKRSSEAVLGDTVRGAVITAPVAFTAQQRQAIRDAGTLAGLSVLRIVNEPTAAALTWVAHHRRAGTLAVYDFGGACFDLSIVRVDDRGAHVLASATQARLGGWDLDLRIIQWLIEEFFTQHLIDVSTEALAMQRLRDAAERAKLELSSAGRTEIRLPFLTADDTGPKHIQKTLTREDFHGMVQDLLERTLVEYDALLESAGVRADELDDVVLVGGSSRMPGVRSLVEARVGKALHSELNPDELIAVGAAVQAHMLEGSPVDRSRPTTRLSLGLDAGDGAFHPLLPRGTPVPARATWELAPMSDALGGVRIHLVQGESPRAADGIPLGELEVGALDPEADRTIRLTFSVEEDNLTAIAEQGRDRRAVLRLPGFAGVQGVGDEDALTEADGGEEETAEGREARRMRDVLARHLSNLERLRREHQERLTVTEVADLDAALKRGRVAVLKTNERPAYFQEMTNYIFHFYTNLTTKLGV